MNNGQKRDALFRKKKKRVWGGARWDFRQILSLRASMPNITESLKADSRHTFSHTHTNHLYISCVVSFYIEIYKNQMPRYMTWKPVV